MTAYHDAVDRYQGYRDAVYERTQASLIARIPNDETLTNLRGRSVHLRPIDGAALAVMHPLWVPQVFPWATLMSQASHHPSRFEVSLWADEYVYAMAIGRSSDGDDNVTIHFAERCLDGRNPFRGITVRIITDVANLYAKVIDKRRLKLKDPVAEAIPTYLREGYTHTASIGSSRYMERRVQ